MLYNLIGRRTSIMIFDVIFMVGTILTIIVNTDLLMAGRFI
jgi:hypothetical protein